MQRLTNFKRVILMITIVTLMAVSIPVTAYGDEQPETIKKEYIITSSGDLSAVKEEGHIVDVILADSHTALIKLDSAANLDKARQMLTDQFPDLTVQPNYVYETTSVNDPYYDLQWGLLNTAGGVDIGFEEAQNFIESKKPMLKKTVVAVIDTGFDFTHNDLVDNVWINKDEIPGNGKDDDGNGYVDDTYGYDFSSSSSVTMRPTSSEYEHGTHCAGIIGAVSNNNIGITGIASITDKVQLMNLKVLAGNDGEGSSFNLIRAIKYAENNGADICNLSMGSYGNDTALYTAIAKSKMLFVCAAGNDGRNLDNMRVYPGSYDLDNVICVANMKSNGTLNRLSNYSSRYVELAAPGTEIYSTVPGDKYRNMSGTSMATPYVSGVAALLHSYYNGISAAQMRQLIIEHTTYSQNLRGRTETSGYLNAYEPLSAYDSDAFKPDETAPVVTASVVDIEGSYKQKLVITATDDSGETPEVRYVRGDKTLAYFRGGKGYDVNLDEDNTGSKTMAVPSVYSIYAVDSSGNDVLYQVECTADAVKSIKLNYIKKTVKQGKTYKLKTTLSKSGTYGRKVTYTSSKKSVATVSSNGKVTAKKKGITTITAKTENGLTAKCKIVVK
ncbi:Thermophilic serine proteinase precursor [uncultured Eubacterium sp.]|nr:Thermophilic serine proteinase precursor [uncultured Eubacterium sp.]